MKLFLPANQEVNFSNNIPPELHRFAIPGSLVRSARGAFGLALLQGLPPQETGAWHSVLHMARDTVFTVKNNANGHGTQAKLHILIKTDQLMQLPGLGDVFLQEGEANLLYTPHNEFTHYYKKGKEYISLDFYYSLNQLAKWRALFPALGEFVQHIEQGQPAVLSGQPLNLTAAIFSIIHDIIHCTYTQPYHHLFFENKASLLLFLMLVQTIEPIKDPWFGDDKKQIHSILRAKSIITNDERYHYNIHQIASEVGLNEVKLKQGFKHVFGVGLYGFLMSVRMDKARELLQITSKSVKEISNIIGYKSTSSFIKIFKQRHGHSPYAWRRMQKAKHEGMNGNNHHTHTHLPIDTTESVKKTEKRKKG